MRKHPIVSLLGTFVSLALILILISTARAEVFVSSRGSDNTDSRIVVFDDAGNYVRDFGAGATLDGPVGLRINPTSGELLVASNRNSKVLRYNPVTGQYLGVFAQTGNLNGPSDIAFAQNNDLYVANFGTTQFGGGSTVARLSSSGSALADFATGLSNPASVAFGADPDGAGSQLPDVFVSNFDFTYAANGIVRYSSAGGALSTITDANLNGPAGLTINPADGKLYAAALLPDLSAFQNHVLRVGVNVTPGTEIVEPVADGGNLAFPSGLLFLGGDMLVSNSGSADILRYSPDGFGGYTANGNFASSNLLVQASNMLHFVGGDFNADGVANAADIDILWHVVRGIGSDPGDIDTKDLNGDGVLNEDDVDYLLANLLTAGPNRRYGDADLVGGVGPDDFTAWRIGGSGWAHGDFDGTGDVGPDDFTLWRTAPAAFPSNVGPRPGSLAVVPEPATLSLLALGLPALMWAGWPRRRSA